ncbi:hypothetical protein RxyAA322_16460 [Rubrobacter xylanophilus]|uniref:DUF1468 domain-containing protein n=1 Tax=Rubrobacter xylanophilus TaxID=49319 RepID=A0A510HIH4_9ACTN|nr:tripartite tricarboxylate transporter TctB family protein [Rubrobacter xylanophilus]BBL79792.1 hypothetical protein RxyAA322_16460 [Rubrobacter xylanophilus]
MRVRDRLADSVTAGLLLVLAVATFALTLGFPAPGQPNDPGSAAFPRIIAVALAALAILQLARPQRAWDLPKGAASARVAGVVALLAAYAALLEPLGFILASFGFLLATFSVAGVRRPLFLAVLPAAISVTLYYAFYRLLEVPLPQGLIEGLLP